MSDHVRFCHKKVQSDSCDLRTRETDHSLFLSLAVGETASGKASRSLAQHIPGPGGMEGMKGAASGVVGDLARARIALDERGQKLGELEERTAAMMASADSFSKHAHDVRARLYLQQLKHCFHVKLLLSDFHLPVFPPFR